MAARGIEGLFDEKGDLVSGVPSNAVKAELGQYDNTTYAVSPTTGAVVSNQLQDADLNEYLPGTVTYLSRSDWNTFPESYTGLTATDAMAELMIGKTYQKPGDAPDTGDMVFGEDAGLKLVSMKDVEFGSVEDVY